MAAFKRSSVAAAAAAAVAALAALEAARGDGAACARPPSPRSSRLARHRWAGGWRLAADD